MNRERLNFFANVLLDILPAEGIPESYLYLAAEQAGLPAKEALDTLVALGLLSRGINHVIQPGPKWDIAVQAKKRFQSAQGEVK